jgi:DNA-binding NarL/FixJ family response regulator
MLMRVVIVAGGPLAAESLRGCLRSVPPFDIVGYADARRPCSASVRAAAPDLVIVDGREPSDETLDCIADVRAGAPTAKVVMLTRDVDHDWLALACDRGLDAAVSVTVGTPGIGNLVRQVALGAVFHRFAPAAEPTSATSTDYDLELLTARELEILRLVASGASNCQVAATLWVTEQTIKFHLSNTYRKLGVANRTEASHYAYTHGLFEAAAAAGVLEREAAVAA